MAETARILRYFLNKRIILIGLIISLLIISGWFLIFPKNKALEIKLSKKSDALEIIELKEMAKDSDNDGLKDWEEALWKTDPQDPDTDKDGASDGQEIKENRNPLLAGPNDKLNKTATHNSAAAGLPVSQQIDEQQSFTATLGQEFLSAYLSAKEKANGQIQEEDKNKIIASFLAEIDKANSDQINKIILFSESDLKISSENSKDSIKKYGNSFALIIKKYFDPIPESELQIVKKSLLTGEKSEFSKLKTIADAYREAAKESYAITVPLDFADYHLNLLNSFEKIADEISAMQTSYGNNDPILTLLALKRYDTAARETYQNLKYISDYFTKKEIFFGNNEPANLFKIYE